MYFLKKSLCFLFLTIIVVPQVQAGNKEEAAKLQGAICDVVGKITKQAGQFRDKGLSQQETTNTLMKGVNPKDTQVTKIVNHSISLAYQNKKTTPEQLRVMGHDQCLQAK